MKIQATAETTPIEALEALAGREEDSMKHFQKAGLEYLRRNLKIQDQDSFNELQSELSEIDSIKSKHVLKLLEILPTHEKEVQAIFSKERVKLNDQDIQRITDICSSFSAE